MHQSDSPTTAVGESIVPRSVKGNKNDVGISVGSRKRLSDIEMKEEEGELAFEEEQDGLKDEKEEVEMKEEHDEVKGEDDELASAGVGRRG